MNNYREYEFNTEDYVTIYGQSWHAESDAKAVLIILHGLLEHSGIYKEMAGLFTKHKIHVLAIDMRGFGRSNSISKRKISIQHMCKDLDLIIHDTEELFPDLPKIIFGHDLGALLALNYASSKVRKIHGLIASAPLFTWEHKYSSNKLLAGSVCKFLFPNWHWELKIAPEDLSVNEKPGREIFSDAKSKTSIPVKLFFDILELGKKTSKCVYKINVPLLVMHGIDDNIVPVSQSRKFVQHTSDKTSLMEWEGARHMLHRDDCKDKVVQHMLDWTGNIL